MRNSKQAGWRPAEYFPLVGISRQHGYTLPVDMQPQSVRLGAARVIIEPPGKYLARVAKLQSDKAA